MKLPKATDGSAWYLGKFEAPAFKLWGSPAMLAEKLFDVLKPHGAVVQDFRIEGSGGSAALVYEIKTYLNFVVRVKLDALEITFNSLTSIGTEKAIKIGTGCWQAIKEADESIDLFQHEVTISGQHVI